MTRFRNPKDCLAKYRPSIVAVVLVSVLAALACGADSEAQPPESASQSTKRSADLNHPPAGGVVEVVNQDAGGSGKYNFVPSDFKFKRGEAVTFTMTAEAEFHTFTVDELGIDESVDAGDSVTFTDTFDRPGSYKLICIPHEALGMVGRIVVG